MASGFNLLTCAEVAKALGVTAGRVRQFAVEERLPIERKIGKSLLFSPRTVAAFARKKRPSGRPKKNQ